MYLVTPVVVGIDVVVVVGGGAGMDVGVVDVVDVVLANGK